MDGPDNLKLDGKITDLNLDLEWTKPEDIQYFHLTIDKCSDRDCSRRIINRNITDTSFIQTNTIFEECSVFDVRLAAINDYGHTIYRSEIRLKKTFTECHLTPETVLGVGLSILCILLLGGIICLYLYQRRNPSHRLTRVRSRIYSRIYTQERFQVLVKKESIFDHVNSQLITQNPFEQEFLRLEKLCEDTIQKKTIVAEFPTNKKRNRYNDIVPFDSTRVRIIPPYKISCDLESSDYINASFISDICENKTSRKYIAAQGPGDDTTPAFWSMIWQYDVRVIVMLTAVVESCGIKCNAYWPQDKGQFKKFGCLTVQLFDHEEAPTYVIRKFDVSHSTVPETRVVVQIQYIMWPDRTVPHNCEELIQLVQLTRVFYNQFANKNRRSDQSSPILVHCSAGVGRSGTYICVDQMMTMLDNQKTTALDVFNTVYQLRKDRRYMVQTREQYAYVYRCLLQYANQRNQKTGQTAFYQA